MICNIRPLTGLLLSVWVSFLCIPFSVMLRVWNFSNMFTKGYFFFLVDYFHCNVCCSICLVCLQNMLGVLWILFVLSNCWMCSLYRVLKVLPTLTTYFLGQSENFSWYISPLLMLSCSCFIGFRWFFITSVVFYDTHWFYFYVFVLILLFIFDSGYCMWGYWCITVFITCN
jgi:hypothetical protein